MDRAVTQPVEIVVVMLVFPSAFTQRLSRVPGKKWQLPVSPHSTLVRGRAFSLRRHSLSWRSNYPRRRNCQSVSSHFAASRLFSPMPMTTSRRSSRAEQILVPTGAQKPASGPSNRRSPRTRPGSLGVWLSLRVSASGWKAGCHCSTMRLDARARPKRHLEFADTRASTSRSKRNGHVGPQTSQLSHNA